MPKVEVDLKERSYDIQIDIDCLDQIGRELTKFDMGSKCVIITDSVVNRLYGHKVKKSLKKAGFEVITLKVPRGEEYKNAKQALRLIDKMVKAEIQRDSVILALGGGVIGDLAGFAAAVYMRGINLIQVPTTLLAQVDAAIGGKTGVNHPQGKNLIGVFYQPRLVFADVMTFTTLPEKEIRTGLSEVIKYGIIWDSDFFKFIEENALRLTARELQDKETQKARLKIWQIIVAESAKIKAKVVIKDEKESGLRAILNFGHTIGHAIESLTRYAKYTHGEANSIGMVAACRIAQNVSMLEEKYTLQLKQLLDKIGLPTQIEEINANAIINTLHIDKKVRKGRVRFVLPTRFGTVEVRDDIPIEVVNKSLKETGAS
jgi:3-dehydroquinate synthase